MSKHWGKFTTFKPEAAAPFRRRRGESRSAPKASLEELFQPERKKQQKNCSKNLQYEPNKFFQVNKNLRNKAILRDALLQPRRDIEPARRVSRKTEWGSLYG